MLVTTFGVGPWGVPKAVSKLFGEIRIIAKTASVGNRADRLTGVQNGAWPQKACGMIQTHGIQEMSKGRISHRKQRRFAPLALVRRRNNLFANDSTPGRLQVGKVTFAW
jgi:hypothetical protein